MKKAEKKIARAKPAASIAPIKPLDHLLVPLRGQDVILAGDVAQIYKVETRAINQAVLRNREKFPRGYILELTPREWQSLKSHFVISNGRGGARKPPKAFTEKGLYMLATVLKSRQATRASLQIIETFAKVREFSRAAKALAVEKDDGKQKTLVKQTGRVIGEILNQEFIGDGGVKTETVIELNLAMLKVRHTIKRGSAK